MTSRTIFALAVAAIMVGCDFGGTTFTLYRNSTHDETMRIHVASFDATASEKYNGNCEQARDLFQAQSGAKRRFWCEKGPYKK
jgi:hypothetical protein